MNRRKWVVYLIRCSDESIYCGITNNLENRIAAHNSGKGGKYTRSRRPVEWVASSIEMTKSDALKMEYRIKRLSADQKIFQLKKGKVKTTMNSKKELLTIKEKINALVNIIDKLIAAAEAPEKALPKAAKGKTASKAMAGKVIAEKPIVKKDVAPQKIPAKKTTPKKAVVEEKKSPQPAAGKPMKGTAVDIVLSIIKESGKGINTPALMAKTGFNEKKVQNLVFKLRKQGRIKNISKGIYGVA
jgi:putative endonuclease